MSGTAVNGTSTTRVRAYRVRVRDVSASHVVIVRPLRSSFIALNVVVVQIRKVDYKNTLTCSCG